jgi:hypothetical protein
MERDVCRKEKEWMNDGRNKIKKDYKRIKFFLDQQNGGRQKMILENNNFQTERVFPMEKRKI